MEPFRSVDCNGCQACCKSQLITLEPEEDPAAYDCDAIEGPRGMLYALKHKPNGDCVYLDETGCSIHGRQPIVCKSFDCRLFALEWPRKKRREAGMAGWDTVFRAGYERLKAMRRTTLSAKNVRRCRKCGCTEDDCSGCIARTGRPCHWVAADLCSACQLT